MILFSLLLGCATGHYIPLESADKDQVEQIKEHIYRVEYQVSPFTSQEQLDEYLRRRCAELTVREGYDLFHLTQRADVLGLSRRRLSPCTRGPCRSERRISLMRGLYWELSRRADLVRNEPSWLRH